MGTSIYSAEVYTERQTTRAAAGVPVFAHDHAVQTGAAERRCHPGLNILGRDRESRDSTEHPQSRAIVVMFDNTGSMGRVPKLLQAKLPKLMSLLLQQRYCGDADPQVLFGCVGDFTTDDAPLQIGQWESGVELDDAFERMLIEGRGGSGNCESYELAMYYLARHTQMDCYEKRNERGLAFIIGDENPYPLVSRDQVKQIIGDTLQSDVRVEEIAAELRRKFDVYFLCPAGTSYYNDDRIKDRWVQLLGSAERFVKVADPTYVCEVIAGIVGMQTGAVDLGRVVSDLAADNASRAVQTVSNSLEGLERARRASTRRPRA